MTRFKTALALLVSLVTLAAAAPVASAADAPERAKLKAAAAAAGAAQPNPKRWIVAPERFVRKLPRECPGCKS